MVKGNQNEEVEGGYLCVKVTHFDCSERARSLYLKLAIAGNRSTLGTHACMNGLLQNQKLVCSANFSWISRQDALQTFPQMKVKHR